MRDAAAGLVGAGLALSAIGWLCLGFAGAAEDDLTAVWRDVFARAPTEAASGQDRSRQALGIDLLADARLSSDETMSCVSCHIPARGFSDGLVVAQGRDGRRLQRNTPTLYGIAAATRFNWDGSAASLIAQLDRPITSRDEMAGVWPTILSRLNADTGLVHRFQAAFGGRTPISEAQVKQVLVAGLTSLVPPATRFDRWIVGQAGALSALEKQGFELFVGRGQCATCHSGWRLTDDQFYDIGLASADPGRGAVPGGIPGVRAFKTPTLRAVALTAPYFHDGSAASLAEVVAHYAGGVAPRRSVSSKLRRDLHLTQGERAALVAFLETL